MQIDPTPVRRPPILVGGSGKKGTLRQVATWADACNVNEELKLNVPGRRMHSDSRRSPRSSLHWTAIWTISAVRATRC